MLAKAGSPAHLTRFFRSRHSVVQDPLRHNTTTVSRLVTRLASRQARGDRSSDVCRKQQRLQGCRRRNCSILFLSLCCRRLCLAAMASPALDAPRDVCLSFRSRGNERLGGSQFRRVISNALLKVSAERRERGVRK